MEFTDVVKGRWSCKAYDSSRQVKKEQLEEILEAARMAPTAKNLQEQHIYVVQKPEMLEMIDKGTPCRYGAPTVLIVAWHKDNVYTYPDGKRESGVEDAAIIATHMMLAAANAGVDSCWLNCIHADELHEMFQLPEDEEILMLLDLGYAATDAKPKPTHYSRKPIEETVTWL